jgi:CBS domain-containing protein
MPTCKEVMTPNPATCEPGDPVVQVARIMKQEDVGSVPMVESRTSMRLVGIVTDRDLVIKVVAEGRDINSTIVREAMTANPVSCREDDDVKHVLAQMKERQVRRMPIVDSNGVLLGIIAQADIATRINKDTQTGELVEAISESSTSRR